MVHYELTVLLVAAVLNILSAERLDFSLLLVLVAAIAGLVWLLDHLLFAPALQGARHAARAVIRRSNRCR